MTAWSDIDNFRLVCDLMHLVSRYRVGVRNNLLGFKAQAQAQAVPVDQLATQVAGQGSLIISTIVDPVTAITGNATARAELDDGLTRLGFTRTGLAPAFTALRNAAQALIDAPKTSYAEIVAACDGFLNAIPPPRTFWPE